MAKQSVRNQYCWLKNDLMLVMFYHIQQIVYSKEDGRYDCRISENDKNYTCCMSLVELLLQMFVFSLFFSNELESVLI